MKPIILLFTLTAVALIPVRSQSPNPFAGRWDLTLAAD